MSPGRLSLLFCRSGPERWGEGPEDTVRPRGQGWDSNPGPAVPSSPRLPLLSAWGGGRGGGRRPQKDQAEHKHGLRDSDTARGSDKGPGWPGGGFCGEVMGAVSRPWPRGRAGGERRRLWADRREGPPWGVGDAEPSAIQPFLRFHPGSCPPLQLQVGPGCQAPCAAPMGPPRAPPALGSVASPGGMLPHAGGKGPSFILFPVGKRPGGRLGRGGSAGEPGTHLTGGPARPGAGRPLGGAGWGRWPHTEGLAALGKAQHRHPLPGSPRGRGIRNGKPGRNRPARRGVGLRGGSLP